jgi:hypothetical protein
VERLPPEKLDEAKTLLVSALSKISGRWVKEFLTINNYMKHNSVVKTYAPKFEYRNRLYNLVFLYIHDFSGDYVNDSILKKILLSELDDSSNGTLNKDIFEEEVVLKIGGLNISEVLGIEFIYSEGLAGISVHSVLRLMSRMCKDINEIHQRKDYGCGCPIFKESDLKFLNAYDNTLREELEML